MSPATVRRHRRAVPAGTPFAPRRAPTGGTTVPAPRTATVRPEPLREVTALTPSHPPPSAAGDSHGHGTRAA